MEEIKPNFAAEIGAVIRDIETEKPENERLCYDPIAKAFIGKTIRIIGMANRNIPPHFSLTAESPRIKRCPVSRLR